MTAIKTRLGLDLPLDKAPALLEWEAVEARNAASEARAKARELRSQADQLDRGVDNELDKEAALLEAAVQLS